MTPKQKYDRDRYTRFRSKRKAQNKAWRATNGAAAAKRAQDKHAEREGQPCSRCGVGRRTYYSSHCLRCLSKSARGRYKTEYRQEERRTWHVNNKARTKKKRQVRNFGPDFDYEALAAAQNWVCKICSQPPKSGRGLATDHDHQTNRVRGLLCMHCNTGIGHFKDSITLLLRAVQYLRDSNTLDKFAPTPDTV